ncbi:MAG TPA: hypothetical protein VFE37_15895 [Chloroflexota bacterium]|nr:hypothetical protein [Chloroflexota bacterium]
MGQPAAIERVVLDTSALLGANRRYLVAAAGLRYYTAFWSSWIVAEFIRKRTEWIADRAVREGCDRAELRRRLREAKSRVNRLVDEMSHVFQSVDYAQAKGADLSWLADADDHPIMLTALSAAADVLVTDNAADFPLGESRCGVLLLGSEVFLTRLSGRFPQAQRDTLRYLGESGVGGAPSKY